MGGFSDSLESVRDVGGGGALCAEKCGVVEHNHLENGAKEATLGAQIQQVFFSISAKEEFQWDSDNKLAGGHGVKTN